MSSTAPAHRGPGRAEARLRFAVHLTKVALLSATAAIVLGLVLSYHVSGLGGSTNGAAVAAAPTAEERDVADAIVENDCSLTGLPTGEIPGSALIRNAAGSLEIVTFNRGWIVHSSTSDEELIAFCRPVV